MKKKILLLDSGVTVQKIVSLSIDKTEFHTFFATTKEEGKRIILSEKPDLVLVSDRLNGLEWSSFPKEVETWLGRQGIIPTMVLLASGQLESAKHYQEILNKPFTPQDLQSLLERVFSAEVKPNTFEPVTQLFEEAEEEMVTASQIAIPVPSQTMKSQSSTRNQLEDLWQAPQESVEEIEELSPRQAESISDLWGTEDSAPSLSRDHSPAQDPSPVLSTEESVAYKSLLENQVQQKLEANNLNEMVEKVLARLLPPLVERLVQERLDQLLAEQEQEGTSSLHL